MHQIRLPPIPDQVFLVEGRTQFVGQRSKRLPEPPGWRGCIAKMVLPLDLREVVPAFKNCGQLVLTMLLEGEVRPVHAYWIVFLKLSCSFSRPFHDIGCLHPDFKQCSSKYPSIFVEIFTPQSCNGLVGFV